ncbi:MAG: SUMF1/EgtB/PvdO family nonheme iron enzyme, partial [Ardenticatenaceae bacterium]|nr:SUMF1/EgtB/PvdO family nonheme iron enzyme [Ardenticatenaceae bacterium]
MNDDQKAELKKELEQIRQAITGQEASRGILPDDQIDAILQTLRAKQRQLTNALTGSGAIAQGEGATAVGAGGVNVEGGVGRDVITGKQIVVQVEAGATVVINEDAPVAMDAVDRQSALGRYLQHLIARNRYLQLQGIRSGGRLVHIELENIYITLRATQQRTVQAEEAWLAQERGFAPGEKRVLGGRRETVTETVTVSVNEALAAHRHLVVLGDPGSGKTTLLRYLALMYARDLAQGGGLVPATLGLAESGSLPILLPLRQIGAFLKARPDDGTEGHALLLEFLYRYLKNERVDLPANFFDDYLVKGQAVILLDGMDEVASSDSRRRVARLIEAFTRAYPQCRSVVTSRIVGYTGSARLSEGYVTATVRDFTLKDVEQFLTYWHRLVAYGQMGPGESARHYAAEQTRQLMAAISGNERIRELAINPLMLTVIALVHRDRVKLPDRRAELYAEAVDVLLGKWDEARGVAEPIILRDRPFDIGDRRLMLQSIALHMHEKQQKEIEADELRHLLFDRFNDVVRDDREAERAVGRFLQVIEERTGLFVARGEGIYAFSHTTFQEYLTALAIAGQDDYVVYTLSRMADSWWREVVLLEAGYLSMSSRERTTRLIKAIANTRNEPAPYHNLILAAECLRDVGRSRVQGAIAEEIPMQLRSCLEVPPSSKLTRFFGGGLPPKSWIEGRAAVVDSMVRGGSGYWTKPYGEPEWVEIPAGEFIMGSEAGKDDEKPQHTLHLNAFWISRVPITNAQYLLFVEVTGHRSPRNWEDNRPPKGLESHPVVAVDWH